jgi:ectoine hydroxylase-related dioxygenase (phytanoyl-CoA dioxygenase family)
MIRDRVEEYERRGVVFPVRVLTDREAAAYRSALAEVEALSGGALRRLDQAHRFFPWAYRLATHEAVVAAAAALLGDDLFIDGTLALSKPPHDPSYVSWHQDSVYSRWHLFPSVSAWVALSPSNARSGCMRVVQGSHKLGKLAHEEVADPSNLLRRGERVGVEVAESEAVDVELRPGEMSLHHCNIIHGSNPNRTDEARVGFIVRFVTRGALRDGESIIHARREPSEAPAEVGAAEALAAWREFAARRTDHPPEHAG